jgi:hypothetical protein
VQRNPLDCLQQPHGHRNALAPILADRVERRLDEPRKP